MKYLVTSALPYANAPLHLGHVLEIVQTDVWVRHKNLSNEEALYFCASDTHGTPIMLKAKEMNVTPEELIKDIHEQHHQIFKSFNVKLANFHSTHSEENKHLTSEIFRNALENRYIHKKEISQLYDESEQIFLADRFIKGTCPACGAKEQYGDACEKCGSTYDALELKDPISVLSNTKPVVKKSEHYFFKLNELHTYLKKNVQKISNQSPIRAKLDEWLNEDLRDWDVSRDEPYFGFNVPGEESKYIYVWMDAPVGYLSSIQNWANQNDIDYVDLMNEDNVKLVHFIGKDIVYFHLLFWPAMLKTYGINNLDEVFVHGFLTIEGNKMSKSKGNFILADKALTFANPDYYRYYFCSKLNTDISDIDFSVSDFVQKINSDLIGKFINIGSRTQNFLVKLNNSKIAAGNIKKSLEFKKDYDEIINLIDKKEYSKALKNIMNIADKINAYVSSEEPWNKAKNGEEDKCIAICSEALNVFKDLTILLQSFIPSIADNIFLLLNASDFNYDDLSIDNLNEVQKFEPFITRLEKNDFDGILD
jgi:methionyl-tRNA synthetase